MMWVFIAVAFVVFFLNGMLRPKPQIEDAPMPTDGRDTPVTGTVRTGLLTKHTYIRSYELALHTHRGKSERCSL